jgi:predicted dehydrogenase
MEPSARSKRFTPGATKRGAILRRDPTKPILCPTVSTGTRGSAPPPHDPSYGNGYYHPGNWRKRLDFGTGTFGDMGCHIYDPVFKALELTAPISLRSDGARRRTSGTGPSTPASNTFFPGTKFTEGKTVKVIWYDGNERPPKEVQPPLGDDKLPDQGSLFMRHEGHDDAAAHRACAVVSGKGFRKLDRTQGE